MDDSSDTYADIGEWYDIEHDALTEDIECYLALLALPDAGYVHLLEIGSGSGRIAAKLAAAGHTVTGIEPSLAMRNRAETRRAGLPDRVRHRLRFVEGTATEPNLPTAGRFDAILYGLNTLAHLLTVEERLTAMRRAAALIRPEGQLLLDLDLLGTRKLAQRFGQIQLQGQWRLPNSASTLQHFITATPSEQPDAIQVHHVYDRFEQGGTLKRTLTTMTLATPSYGEVVGNLRNAGFEIEATYGDHNLSPYENESPRLIVDSRLPRV